MAALKHIHKYERTDIGTNKPYIVHRCVLNCSHYLPWKRSTTAPIIGKKAICWRCSQVFEIKYVNSLMKRPHCSACIKRKNGLNDNDIGQLLHDSQETELEKLLGESNEEADEYL